MFLFLSTNFCPLCRKKSTMRNVYPVFVGARPSVQLESMEVVDLNGANGAEEQVPEDVRE